MVNDEIPPSALPPRPPEAWEPLFRLARRVARPLDRFLHIEAASGVLLIAAAALALLLANSPLADGYAALWRTPVGLRLGPLRFERSLEWVVNDGLMVIFFFVVGMEIRRELHHGALSEWRRAALPAAAALGGMAVPALLYLLVAGQGAPRPGWGVPMATDIAFAVGVLTLLGERVPASLRVLLLALAVIDDLGAIVVIAIFYSSGFSALGFAVAALGLGAIVLMQRLGVRARMAYVPPAVLTWAGVYAAGVHPTIAGVLVGFLTPVRAWLGPDGFLHGIHEELDELGRAAPASLSTQEMAGRLRRVDVMRREALSPAEDLIDALHPFVAFGIMPLFALANAGVRLSGLSLDGDAARALVGAALGLVLGKPLGVLLACWLSIRLRVAALPAELGPRHLVVLGATAGIGFTMALFIAQLAFADGRLLGAAKLGVLLASAAAAVLALLIGRLLLPAPTQAAEARSADDAECS